MERALGTVRLRDGRQAELLVVEAPDAGRRDEILALLAHKGPEWQVHLHEALAGRTNALETRWYLAEVQGELVANAMTVERHGVGILGHVFTREAFRQRGLCNAVLGALMEDFRSRNGRALVLGTGYESVAYRIYESFGFRSLRGGFMEYLAEPREEFDAEWFGPGDAETVPARWEHWPLVAMLAARPAGYGLRSVAWGLRDISNLEHPYCTFMGQVMKREAAGAVAVTGAGAVVACATVTPFVPGGGRDPWAETWLVDAFAHSLHTYKLEATIAGLPRLKGKHVAFVPAADETAVAAFLANGFVREGLCRGLVADEPLRRDVVLLGREVG